MPLTHTALLAFDSRLERSVARTMAVGLNWCFLASYRTLRQPKSERAQMHQTSNSGPDERHFDIAQHWAMELTRRRSVTGTSGEVDFAEWLAHRLMESDCFGIRRDVWTFPVADGDARQCVAMLLRRGGRRTVILTGHYDTVSIDDYGDLSDLATEPQELAVAMRQRLANPTTAAAQRAESDLAANAFLPGRGLLDMKAGLAAGLSAIAALATEASGTGNVLFIAVPDEENGSAGARRAAQLLPEIALRHDLDIAAVINLDAIADDQEGHDGRVIALGTVGKLLPTALVIGTPAHSGFPFNGINAGALAAAIAARVEWAEELTETLSTGAGAPPSLLSLRDGKTSYDVTTPATAFAYFNVLTYRRTPIEVLTRFDALCAEALAQALGELRARAVGIAGTKDAPLLPGSIPIYNYEDVAAAARKRQPGNDTLMTEKARTLATQHLSLPESCRLMTEHAWLLSGLAGPAVVTGFGSVPYLSTQLSSRDNARHLRTVAVRAARHSEARYGCVVRCVDYFAGISDMSFFGEADESNLNVVGRNTPLWEQVVRWPDSDGIANVPTINIGPWGRDYHTPLERLHTGYAFDILPRLLADVVSDVLNG